MAQTRVCQSTDLTKLKDDLKRLVALIIGKIPYASSDDMPEGLAKRSIENVGAVAKNAGLFKEAKTIEV